MAIFHLSVKVISRGKGKSAVGAAAYRSSEKIENEYDGVVHDYTRKRGIIHTQILLPFHAPAKYYNRSVLWNAVEKWKKQRTHNSQEISKFLCLENCHFPDRNNLLLGLSGRPL